MALAITTVTDSISKLSVTGLTIKDIDEIPYTVADRDCPIMYPEPLNFITDIDPQPVSFGTGGSGYHDVTYRIHYTFLYRAVGADRGSLTNYSGFVQLYEDVIDKMLDSNQLTGAVDVRPVGNLAFGVVMDPAGNKFIGAELQFAVLDFE